LVLGCATNDSGGTPGTPGTPVKGCQPGVDGDGDGIADVIDGNFDHDGDGVLSRQDLDSDGDGLSDTEERRGAGPCANVDSDGDGFMDHLDTDSDDDGLSDTRERELGTDPTSVDSDGDGVTDLAEVDGSRTDPLDPTSTISPGDFFVVLPFEGPTEVRSLRFGTDIAIADVFFLMDSTGSMTMEIGNVQVRMERVIIPGVEALIPDVHFGAGGFADFPVGDHGFRRLDVPYYHLSDIVAPDQDLGLFIPGDTSADVAHFEPTGPNGTSDIVDAVRSYPRRSGGTTACEAGAEALYQTATAEGVAWVDSFDNEGAVPAKTCAQVPDEIGLRRGYPCFRPGALPIIVYVSDACFHNPLPSRFPLNTAEGSRCDYDNVPTAHTYEEALSALRDIGARVVALSSADIPAYPGYPATAHMCQLAEDTGSVRADGSPLCFEIGPSGTMIDSDIVNAIAELVGGTPQDVGTRLENVPGNPDNFDATQFIQSIVPVEGFRDGLFGAGYASKDDTVFHGVIPGTQVEFSVEFHNDARPPPTVAEIHQARIIVVGNGVADLDSRNVYIIVPPEGGTILI